MNEIFRIMHPDKGYSTGGCPPTFTWDDGRAKIWTRRGDVIRHLKLLEREGYGHVIDQIKIQHAIFDTRASVGARTFLNEFEDLREKRRIERETRRQAREAALNPMHFDATKYANELKDPVKSALDALLKSV